MIALASVLIVVVVSLLITRVATVALTLTGLSAEVARFQARSALSGVGFTTGEAESVVNHPVRRRIVLMLMLVGSAGIVTVMATLLLSFVGTNQREALSRLGVLLAGLIAILWLARSDRFGGLLAVAIARVLDRWTDLDARDYASLLHVGGGYGVAELAVNEGGWIAGRSIAELELRDEGVVALGIERREGEYVGAPGWETRVRPGDVLVAYGPVSAMCELAERPAGPEGDEAHARAAAERRSRGQSAPEDVAGRA